MKHKRITCQEAVDMVVGGADSATTLQLILGLGRHLNLHTIVYRQLLTTEWINRNEPPYVFRYKGELYELSDWTEVDRPINPKATIGDCIRALDGLAPPAWDTFEAIDDYKVDEEKYYGEGQTVYHFEDGSTVTVNDNNHTVYKD